MLGRSPPFATRGSHACLFDVAPDRGCRVSPCDAAARCRMARYGDGRIGARNARPRRSLVSVVLFLSRARRRNRTGWLAVTLPCGVRTFLDGFASTAIARPALQHVFYYSWRLRPQGAGRRARPTAFRGFLRQYALNRLDAAETTPLHGPRNSHHPDRHPAGLWPPSLAGSCRLRHPGRRTHRPHRSQRRGQVLAAQAARWQDATRRRLHCP